MFVQYGGSARRLMDGRLGRGECSLQMYCSVLLERVRVDSTVMTVAARYGRLRCTVLYCTGDGAAARGQLEGERGGGTSKQAGRGPCGCGLTGHTQ